MKSILIIKLFAIIFVISSILFAKDYDPLKVQTYTLDNGLTVYLNEDHNTTSVFGAVVVRGGGKRDQKLKRNVFLDFALSPRAKGACTPPPVQVGSGPGRLGSLLPLGVSV